MHCDYNTHDMGKLRVTAFACTVALLFLSTTLAANSSPALAQTDAVKWSRFNTPAQGEAGKWVLAAGSDVRCLTMAADGTLLAYANPAATNQRLFKSTDGGRTWSTTGDVTAAVVDIAVAPGNPMIVYYATVAGVFRSTDGGAAFVPLPPNPGGAGGGNVAITAVTVASVENSPVVAVATRDGDPGQFGGVYLLDESTLFPRWSDTGIGSYDVMTIASSPAYAQDRQLVAVATDETTTVVTARVGTGGWGMTMPPVTVNSVAAVGASIAFPEDYVASAAESSVFVGIDTAAGRGDVFRVDWGRPEGRASGLGAGPGLAAVDITALSAGGKGNSVYLLAGAGTGSQVFASTDAGRTWNRSTKEPTGQAVTGIVAASDFPASRRAYATTSGTESAFSVSANGGESWNQTGLIDAQISNGGIIDLAVSPQYAQDKTLFMLTWGGDHSIWRTQDEGKTWARVFSGALPSVDTLSFVRTSPDYGQGSQAILLAGSSSGLPVTWTSLDSGDTFTMRIGSLPVDAWAVLDDTTLFVAGYDGTNALISSSQDGGFIYSTPVKAGNQPLKSVVLSPAFQSTRTVVAGSTVGRVYLSTDNGISFKQIGQQLPVSTAGAGLVSVAFDPAFAANKTIYAATDAASTASSRQRIFRYVVGKSSEWESIDANLPVGAIAGQIAAALDGTLYVANSKAVVTSTEMGGIERSLDATHSSPTFESSVRGLNDGATLVGLWVSGNQLFSIDTTNTRLMTFVDTLTLAPVLNAPEDDAGGLEITGLRLEWDGLDGGTQYEWQLGEDDTFSSSPDGFEGMTQGSSCRLPDLDMATMYYWRVRSAEPLLSPWSVKWSFATKLGAGLVAPQLLSPEPGARGVPGNPVFQWSAIASASSYELLVGGDNAFARPLITRTGDESIGATAWQSDIRLDLEATYYWKVRAVGKGTTSAWSAVGAFTIEPAPGNAATPTAPMGATLAPTLPDVTVLPAPTPATPGWVYFLIGAIGLVLILLLAAILLVLVRRR